MGEEQCLNLSREFPYHASVEALVSSPLRRAIYTTLIAFQPVIGRRLPVIALPEAQELGNYRADRGSDLRLLEKEFSDMPVDLSLVPYGWDSKTGRWATDQESVTERARDVRKWLKSRPEKEIVLVTHGGFLHEITEDWSDKHVFNGQSSGRFLA